MVYSEERTIYEFRAGCRLSGEPQRVGEEIERIRTAHGEATPENVLAAARSHRNYIHRYFTWDDHAAAEEYRLTEARHLLRSVAVVVVVPGEKPPEEPVMARAFVRIGPDGDYKPFVEVMSNPVTREETLERARQELRWFRQKYAHLKELAKLFEAIDDELDGK